jgi:hypothetical protein
MNVPKNCACKTLRFTFVMLAESHQRLAIPPVSVASDGFQLQTNGLGNGLE